MEASVILEYVFKGVISVGVGLMIYTLKDFKTSLTKLTDSLTAVTLSLRELIIKDENKSEKLTEIKAEINKMQNDIAHLKARVVELRYKNKE